MYKDAYKSKLYPVLWGLIGLFTNVIGLIVYLIYKKGNVTCDKCGASQSLIYSVIIAVTNLERLVVNVETK